MLSVTTTTLSVCPINISTPSKCVVIIGAGPAGIAAARTLIKAGITPVILEGRERVGGRVCKQVLTQNLISSSDDEISVYSDDEYSQAPSEVVIQLGANWVHGLDSTVNPLYSVAKELKLDLHPTSPDEFPGSDVCLFDSTDSVSFAEITVDDYKSMLRRYKWVTEHIDMDLPDEVDIPLSEAFRLATIASEDITLPFGPCTERERRCLNWCYDRISIDSGISIEKISMRYYGSTPSDGDYGEALVEGGFHQIISHLATEYALDVRLGHTVTSVLKTSHNIFSVKCTNGAIFEAEHVISTIPIGVLQSNAVEFSPRPPQLDRLCQLQFGVMNLVWIWFPYQFWPSGYNFFGLSRYDHSPTEFSTFLVPPMKDQYGNSQAILMCQIFDEFAISIEKMSNTEISEKVVQSLRRVFVTVPDAIGCMHSSWKSDKFSQGSYSCAPPANSSSIFTKDWSTESGVRGLYFAGEACHLDHMGTAHGAYISGVREASKILNTIGLSDAVSDSVFQ